MPDGGDKTAATRLPKDFEGGLLFAIPSDVLVLNLLPRLAVVDVVALSSTCIRLRVEIDSCATLWSGLRAGCTSRQSFQEAWIATCSQCPSPSHEYTFAHSRGLCGHCASRLPAAALRAFLHQRRLLEWRIGAQERACTRASLRSVLVCASERARRPELGSLCERPLQLAFSTKRDGHSLALLHRILATKAPAILLVREAAAVSARSFGVFVPLNLLRRTAPEFKSDQGAGSFLFCLPPPVRPGLKARAAMAPEPPSPAPLPSVFPGHSAEEGTAAGVRDFYKTSSELLAFGGDARAHALELAADLQSGMSWPCSSFHSPTLSSQPRFHVANLEVWHIVGKEEEDFEWKAAQACGRKVRSLDEDEEPSAEGADDRRSILEPGSNRFMMEFVNMREDLLLERRAQ